MAFLDWTGGLMDAPRDVIEAAIQRTLNGAPVPYISPTDALPQVFVEHHPQYRMQYQDLCNLYIREFGEADQLDLNEYGFSTWKSSHPLINALMLVYNKFHWDHMKPIVKQMERTLRLRELNGESQSVGKNRIELIAAMAYEEQNTRHHRAIEDWTNSSINSLYERQRDSTRDLTAMNSHSNTSTGVVDWFNDYNRRNPFTVGLVGATIYHKIKDLFVK